MANKARGEIELKIGDKEYNVRPTMQLIAELEDEFDGLLSFAHRIQNSEWKLTEIVKFLYMLLDSTGKGPDYDDLAEEVLAGGVVNYVEPVITFLAYALSGSISVTSQHSSNEEKKEDPKGEEQAQTANA